MSWRSLSAKATDPSATIRELKRHIHRLYKHIHPDRFARSPEHRAVNEASFQILQSALQRHFDRVEARFNIPPQAHQRPQQLTFFAHAATLPPSKHQQNSELRKAVVKFHERNLGNSLQDLFKSLGIDPPPTELLPGYGDISDGIQFATLTDLIRHARHVVTANIKKRKPSDRTTSDPGDESLITKLALKRARGVHITLGEGLPPKDRQVLIFRRLTRTLLTARGVNLTNLVIELDGGFDVKLYTNGVYPWLVLGACATEDAWLDSLMSAEVDTAVERSRQIMTDMQVLEARTARMMGLRLVMHNISLLSAGENDLNGDTAQMHREIEAMIRGSELLNTYRDKLRELLNEVAARQRTDDATTSLVALMLEEGTNISSDSPRGVLRAGLLTPTATIVSWLHTMGPSLNAEYEQFRAQREAEEKLVSNLRRSLCIDSLRRGEISDEQWRNGLGRLRKNVRRLRGVLDGVPLVVGLRAKLLETGEVEIPFDFDERLVV